MARLAPLNLRKYLHDGHRNGDRNGRQRRQLARVQRRQVRERRGTRLTAKFNIS